MQYIKENWGKIIVYGLILLWLATCVNDQIDVREKRALRQEQREVERKAELERIKLASKAFIEIVEKSEPINTRDFEGQLTIDLQNFFSQSDQKYFYGVFQLIDIFIESGEKVLLLEEEYPWTIASEYDGELVFEIVCNYSIQKKETYYSYNPVAIVFNVENVKKEMPLNTTVTGRCLSATQYFDGLEKLLNFESASKENLVFPIN